MPPPPDRGRGAASRRASSSSRPSRAPLLPQSRPSSKSLTSSAATTISQHNPNAPNPKSLTTLLLPPLPSTPAIPSPHTNINKPNTHQTHSPRTRNPHSGTRQNKTKIGDILSQSLKLNFDIDTTFPGRYLTAIVNFCYDKTDLQQPQRTQTAPQEEHAMNQTIHTGMDETHAATYTEIRQKRRISDRMEDSKLLMDNKYTTYVKLYRNYANSSPIPDNPTKDWFPDELDRDQDNDEGLKLFTQDLNHQPDKEPIFRQHWQDIFTDHDNKNLDIEPINRIQQHMNNITHDIAPYNTEDINRLDPLQFAPITPDELLQTLKTFKQKAPGPSGITTLQLKQLPKNMINYLLYTFDKVKTLQQKNVFLLVDVQIRPTVSISGGLLSGMAENNRDCKATSILITRYLQCHSQASS
ncbi:hypothetical protein FHG87_002716 [Trinorchestia longiramus]|nr:hypothetical protein FHG87_002716 [Trinorchestia longiramus]